GEVDIGLELSFIPKLLGEHHRVAAVAAVRAATSARALLDADKLPRFDAWIRKTFGPAARALSWQVRPGDNLDAELSRTTLVSLVAWSGDAPLRAAAVALAKNWQAPPSANRGGILAVPADADAATFDRLLAAAPTETDPEL